MRKYFRIIIRSASRALKLFCILTFSHHSLCFSQYSEDFIRKFNLAKDFFSRNETKPAFAILKELNKLQPSNSNINYLLGVCYTEEDPNSGKSIYHLEKAMKDVSVDYDASSFNEKRTPIFVYYYLVIAYSQHGKCKEAKQAKNYFHTLYGIEKNDYYVADAEKWVKKCNPGFIGLNQKALLNKLDSGFLITKEIDYTTAHSLYGVQVGAFSRLIPVYEFKGLKNVEAFIDHRGMIRYVIGNFIFKQQAESLLKKIQEAGYHDAFVVDVNKEKIYSEEIVIADHASIHNPELENIVFKVQIGAFRESIPAEIAAVYLTLEGIEEQNSEDLTILSTGNFTSYEEAEKFKNDLVAKGIRDAFIVAYSGSKKIDVKLARNHYRAKNK